MLVKTRLEIVRETHLKIILLRLRIARKSPDSQAKHAWTHQGLQNCTRPGRPSLEIAFRDTFVGSDRLDDELSSTQRCSVNIHICTYIDHHE